MAGDGAVSPPRTVNQATRIAVGLGSNQGDRLHFLTSAFDRLRADLLDGALLSSVYETPAWGGVAKRPFYNAVAVGVCDWKPPAILNLLKSIERELGRSPAPRYGDREIDLDLLVHGSHTWNAEGLVVPHPGLAERQFVLAPLVEIWPEWLHPTLGKTASVLLAELLEKESHAFQIVRPDAS